MRSIILTIIICLLIGLFVYTAVSKLIDPSIFLRDLNNQPFPKVFNPVLVWLIPLTEFFLAFLLLFNTTRLIGLIGSFYLMLLFTLYTAFVLLGLFNRTPCSCGGVIRWLSWEQHLFFNLFFVIISIIGIKLFMHEHRGSRKPV
jgi:putative oxidoreductase